MSKDIAWGEARAYHTWQTPKGDVDEKSAIAGGIET